METFTFPVTWVELTEALLRSKQQPVEPLYRRCDLHPDILNQADASLTLGQFETLLHIICEQTTAGAEPRFLQILPHMPKTFMGMVGMAAMTAHTLDGALDVILRYAPLFVQTATMHRRDSAQHAEIHITLHHDFGTPYNALIMELLAGMFCKNFLSVKHNMLCTTTAGTGMGVEFTHSSREDTEAFRRYFGMPVHFGSTENLFRLDHDILHHQLKTANRAAHLALIQILEQRLQHLAQQQPVTTRVHRLLSNALLSGKLPSAAEIAAENAMSSRTLNRKLLKEGSSLIAIMEDVRIERAKMLLKSSDLTLGSIAHKLGYSGLSTFSRAFKRATGQAPSELRTARV